MEPIGYRLLPDAAAIDCFELHVVARAYRAAWVALHAQEPRGLHRIERLGLSIEYVAPDDPAGNDSLFDIDRRFGAY